MNPCLGTERGAEGGRAAETAQILGVVQADLEGQRALGGVDHLGVGETHGHLQVVPGLVVQAVVWVEAPGPVSRVLYGGGGVLGLQRHERGDGQGGAHQSGDLAQ